MGAHGISPRDRDETKLVERKILELSAVVVPPADWLNLLSAAESVLPKRNGKLVRPSDLNLMALRSEDSMILFAAILQAVGAETTYRTNRRYDMQAWVRIALRFADLSLYVVPPARLNYAVELCMAATSSQVNMDSLRLVNALSVVDIGVVRQLVSEQKIGEWSELIVSRLQERCEGGDDIQEHSDREEFYDPDDYEEWLTESRSLLEAARGFFEWSGGDEPDELSRLTYLVDTVEKPPDPDIPPYEERESYRPASPSSFWTLERMFEDL